MARMQGFLFDPLGTPQITLKEAQQDLSEKVGRGTHCLCCGDWAQIYKYPLFGPTAKTLIWLCQTYTAKGDWVYLAEDAPRWVLTSNSVGKLAQWKLAVGKPNTSEPSKKRLGLWKPTELGIKFVHRQARIPKHVHDYKKTILGFSGGTVDIVDALGVKFDYQKLMRGEY